MEFEVLFSRDHENLVQKNKVLTYKNVTTQRENQELRQQLEKYKVLYNEAVRASYYQRKRLNENTTNDKDEEIKHVVEKINCLLEVKNQNENLDAYNRNRCTICKPEKVSVYTQCTGEGDPIPKCLHCIENNCRSPPDSTDCDGSDHVERLLRAIEENCDSRHLCDATKNLLSRSKTTITGLAKNVDAQHRFLTKYQGQLDCYTNKLNNESAGVSGNGDSEMTALKAKFKLMAENAQNVLDENNNLKKTLEAVAKDLVAKTMMYDELLRKTDTFTEEKAIELNDTIKTLRNELETMKVDYCKTEENIKIKNQDIDNLNAQISQNQLNLGNVETELQVCKTNNIKLTKKCKSNELELVELNDKNTMLVNRIKELTDENGKNAESILSLNSNLDAKQKELEETAKINSKFNEKCLRLRNENEQLVMNTDEINKKLLNAKNKEISIQKELTETNKKLNTAVDEIENLKSELSCVQKDADKTKKPVDCKSIGIQIDLTNKAIESLKSDQDMLSIKNKRLIGEKNMLQKTIQGLRKDIGKLSDTINKLKKSLEQSKINKNTNSKSSDIGIQTNACPVICQSKSDKTLDDSGLNNQKNHEPCNSDLSVSNEGTWNNKCSSDSNNMTTCDCMATILEKQNQLNKMKKSMQEQEICAQKILYKTERCHYDVQQEINMCLEETRLQHQKKMEEVEAQMMTYEIAFLNKKKMLKNYITREKQLQAEIEKMNNVLKGKDQIVDYLQNELSSDKNTLNESKRQIKCLKDTLEDEKTKKCELENQNKALMQQLDIQYKKSVALENKLETVQKTKKKTQNVNEQNVNKSVTKKSQGCSKISKKLTGTNSACCKDIIRPRENPFIREPSVSRAPCINQHLNDGRVTESVEGTKTTSRGITGHEKLIKMLGQDFYELQKNNWTK